MLRKFLALLLFAVFSCELQADDGDSEIWENIKSPITTNASIALYGGTIVTGSLVVLSDQVVTPVQSETVAAKPLGSASKWGDQLGQVYPNAAYALGMLGYGALTDNYQAYRNASLMFQATLYSGLTATALKYTVREPRPNNKNRRNSFPSGHSTTIFAFASYIGCRHALPWGIAAYSAAGFVAFSRLNDNAHYLHDVAGGAAIGAGYGLGVCMAEALRGGKDVPIKTVGYIVPLYRGLAAGITHSF